MQIIVYHGSGGATAATVTHNATSTWTQFTTPAISTGTDTQMTFTVQDDFTTAGPDSA